MWIALSDAFFSIVASEFLDELLVRARVKGDIEKVFPLAKVLHTPGGDYHYRATVDRQTVVDKLTIEIMNIDYPNFKNSVTEKDRHDAYLRCWGAMADFQAGRAPRKKVRRWRVKVNTNRSGEPWTPEEERGLIRYLVGGYEMSKIIEAYRRTPAAITTRLIKLGYLIRDPHRGTFHKIIQTPWYDPKKPT